MMSTNRPRFSITVSDELFSRINDFQHEKKLSTQTKAINEILELGVKALGKESQNEDDCLSAWAESFCNFVNERLESFDETDCSDAGVNYERLCEIAEGTSHISLSEACDIAEILGYSLDTMVGLENSDTSEFVLFEQSLSDTEKKLLDLFRGLNKQGQTYIMQTIDMVKDKYPKEKAPSIDEAM